MEEGNINAMVVDKFCEEVNKLVLCHRCFDNSWGVCDIKPDGDAHSWDRIMIEKKERGDFAVQTDIIVHYKADNPSPEARQKKMEQLEALVRKDLPEDANLLRTHEHGSPGDDTWGLHVHAFYRTQDIADAARMAGELAERIQPREIEEKLGWTYDEPESTSFIQDDLMDYSGKEWRKEHLKSAQGKKFY